MDNNQNYERYYYSFLKESEKRLYKFMANCLLNNQRKFIYILNEENVDLINENLPVFTYKIDEFIVATKVWNALMLDYPEFYYVDINDFNQEGNIILMGKEYDYYSQDEIKYINNELNLILSEFKDINDDYELELKVDEFISNNYVYDNETENYYVDENDLDFSFDKWKRHKEKFTVAGLIKYKKGVCSAFSLLAQYILQNKGIKVCNIETEIKSDSSEVIGHRLIAPYIKDSYYFLDVTFNNNFSKNKIFPYRMFFNMNIFEAEKYYNFFIEDTFPSCLKDTYNYYNQIGYSFNNILDFKNKFEKHLLNNLNHKFYFYFKVNFSDESSLIKECIYEITNKHQIDKNKVIIKQFNNYYTVIYSI